jgi:hypothetical protein
MLLLLAAAATCGIDVGLTHEHAGTLYMALATIGPEDEDNPCTIDMPKHGRERLTRDENGAVNTVVASVATKHVPAEYRKFRGKQVVVDGTCTATIESFAVVALHVINFDFDDQPPRYTAAYAIEQGTPVLAAKLGGCTHGSFARDASLPNAQVLHPIVSDGLASAAQQQYVANDLPTGNGRLDLNAPDFRWDVEVLDHPSTGQRYVSVLARSDDYVNAPRAGWEVYAVAAAGSLSPLHPTNRVMNDTPTFIDLDGQLVVVTHWLHGVQLETLGGVRLKVLWPNVR